MFNNIDRALDEFETYFAIELAMGKMPEDVFMKVAHRIGKKYGVFARWNTKYDEVEFYEK